MLNFWQSQYGNETFCLFILRPDGTITIVPFPLYRAAIISHDYKVSLEKLGQNNLVHCPQKLALPFLCFSFPPIGFVRSSVCQEERTTEQAKLFHWRWKISKQLNKQLCQMSGMAAILYILENVPNSKRNHNFMYRQMYNFLRIKNTLNDCCWLDNELKHLQQALILPF